MAAKDDILLYAAIGVAAYFIYQKVTAKDQDVTTGANTLPSGNPSIEKSVLSPTEIILRTETPKNNTSYFIKESDLSASEKRALRYGFYDIENDKIQYGIIQGVERKTRDKVTEIVQTTKKNTVKTASYIGTASKTIITPIVPIAAKIGSVINHKQPILPLMTQAQKKYTSTPILTVPSTASIVTKKIFG
jgi:hypothetical protein